MLRRLYRAVRPDLRDTFIARVVRGKTFADVGGLWGVVNEKVSVAHRHGASALTMIDIAAPGGGLWEAFEARMRRAGVSGCRALVRDVSALAPGDVPRPFDVVHCSGVLYHHPNPVALLGALRRITGEHMVLSTAITRELVVNRHGAYHVPSSGAIFVPALSERARRVLAAHWRRVAPGALGITEPDAFRPDDFAPWWWLPTAEAAAAMCRAAGFAVQDRGYTWRGNALTMLLAAR